MTSSECVIVIVIVINVKCSVERRRVEARLQGIVAVFEAGSRSLIVPSHSEISAHVTDLSPISRNHNSSRPPTCVAVGQGSGFALQEALDCIILASSLAYCCFHGISWCRWSHSDCALTRASQLSNGAIYRQEKCRILCVQPWWNCVLAHGSWLRFGSLSLRSMHCPQSLSAAR